jgi:hypothetical protein
MRVGLALMCAAALAGCGPVTPSVMEFVDINPVQPRVGDITTVRFRALDNRGQPAAGVQVTFRLASEKAGVNISPEVGVTNKGDGMVSVQITASGGRPSSIVVVAEAGERSVSSPPITFAGTLPSARQLTFQCGEYSGEFSGGIHAIGAFDETRHLIAGVQLDCIAHVADRNGDAVPGALVSFFT